VSTALTTAVIASADTLRVCASGCQYQGLQAAIDDAAPGDTILLRAGETFVGPFILRAKSTSSTEWITIRSDAADGQFPSPGVRLVPSGKPGANTSRSLLPRLLGQGGRSKTTPVIRTAAGAHHYRLQFLEIDGSANLGFETLIALGSDTTAAPATDIVVDRVYAHGHPYKGIKRGVSLNSARTDILNSYISDIKAVNADSQAIAGYNGSGPFRIINNYLEGAGENIIFGGSDPAITNLVPSNIDIQRNHIYKPLSWRNPILGNPGSPRAGASSTTGTLAAGTHYFKIVAIMYTDNATAVSLPSAQVSATVAAGTSVTLRWSGVAGADAYRVYRGSASGGQSVYLQTPSSGTTFTYTGSSERSGTLPTKGTKWTVKNLLQLKNAQHVRIDGNIIENVWAAGQSGYAIVLTPRNQYGGASWVRVRDISFTNNIVRHAAGVIQIVGYDANAPSQQTQRITLRNNLFHGIDSKKWGASAKAYVVGEGSADVVIDRNTLIHTNSSVVYAYGWQTMPGFVYTNNISLHGSYGIMGGDGRPGNYTIDKYFPQAVIRNNVLAGGPKSAYPTPNAFPSVSEWTASFVNLSGGDFRLLNSSVFYAAGVNGSVPGADLGVLYTALADTGTLPPSSSDPDEPDDPGATEPPPPSTSNTPPVARAGGPYTATAGGPFIADGSASSDAEGAIGEYIWHWHDEIVVRASDVAAADIVGAEWQRTAPSEAAGGAALHNPNRGAAKRTSPSASPSSYIDVRFYAAAGVPYRLWIRTRAENDAYSNDSMFVQFSGRVNTQGQAIDRIGTTQASTIVLEEGGGAGLSGWGWNDEAYGSLADPMYFAASGLQTLRIQQREDGIMWDQIVLSADMYAERPPGGLKNDTTVVPLDLGSDSAAVASHTYASPGTYPLVLSVRDSGGRWASALTTVTVTDVGQSGEVALAADADGPYAGSTGQTVTFDATASSAPAGAEYRWTFGDDIVIDSSEMQVTGSRWRIVADSSAAAGAAVENPNLGQAKRSSASAGPTSYVEATFRAAAGVPYRVWIRMRAAGDAWNNDSIYVQFSGAVTQSGSAVYRIGTTGALSGFLEEGNGAGLSGWGWGDGEYGGRADPIYFNAAGEQRIRIQQREDGVRIDQIVISAAAFHSDAPGSGKQDDTIVPVFPASFRHAVASHAFRFPGVFPVTLFVVDGSTTATDMTTATIR
jgi:hypothetical protein